MGRLVLIAVLLVVVGFGAYIYLNLPTTTAVVAGEMAPDFQLEDTKGNKVTLSALRGKVVMVNFWATWCPPCKEEMPSMEKLNQILADHTGQDYDKVAKDTERDNFMSAEESKEYGLIDEVLENRPAGDDK